MDNSKETLLDAYAKNGLTLQNRMVMAPMTRCRAFNNIPNDLMALYYQQRATAGLIITEGTSPSPNGLGYARIPGIYSTAQTEGWKKVTDAVHQKGGKIFVQLMHTGRVGHSANLPQEASIIAPSAISADADMWVDATMSMQKTEMPKAMTEADIKTAIDEFVQAAKNAITAGFDGVELHAANGYLLEQFLNPHSNTRTDEYGGTVENGARFVLEVTKAVAEAIGPDKVGVRLSPYGTFNTMPHYPEIVETYTYLSKELDVLDITYLHVIDYAAYASEEGRQLILDIRKNFNNTLILNGGYTQERSTAAISNGKTDLISFGALFIANPDLPSKFAHDQELIEPDANLFYTADEKGYTDYI